MNRLVWLVPLAILLGLVDSSFRIAYAEPQSAVTLNAGQTLKVFPNNCALALTKNTPALMRIKCKANGLQSANRVQANKANAPGVSRTLNPGDKLKVKANACTLVALKTKPSRIKIKCNPNAVYEWKWENPLPQGNPLYSVSCPSPALCKAVGQGGTILSWNGTAWAIDTSGFHATISNV